MKIARSAFTLIEVVLAIALTATVVYLLGMATELYLVNVEASRTRVESAQLARTLLDQIAADLAAARMSAPAAAMPSGGTGGGPQQPGGQQPGGPGGQSPGGGAGGAQTGNGGAAGAGYGQSPTNGGGMAGPGGGGPAGGATGSLGGPAPGTTQGLYGSADQLRIDRAAYADWERAARDVDVQEAAADADMPVTVRYFLVDKNRLSAQRLAQQGVAKEISTASAAGLYRETMPTAALMPGDPPLPTRDQPRDGALVELLAPEVTALEIRYYNGVDLLDEWDPALDGGLPRGVEICLTMAEPRFRPRPDQEEQQRLSEGRYLESELVEYRRFVRLPLVSAGPPAQMLLPTNQQGGGGAFNQSQPGQGGNQGPGGQGQGGQGQGGAGGGNPAAGGGQ